MKTITELVDALEQQYVANTKVKSLLPILEQYRGDDWEQHIQYAPDTYHKVLLHQNAEFELYLICWDKLQASEIHDHPSNGCILTVLGGELVEELFDIKLNLLSTVTMHQHQSSFIDNDVNYHRVSNHNNYPAHSLHLYSPINYQHTVYQH